MSSSPTHDVPVGARLRAVHFAIDEGLRIWPIQTASGPSGQWRVVSVSGQRVQAEHMTGTFAECQAAYPEARPGINDNETVPPGTEGTVEDVTEAGQVWVRWDNGPRLALTARDRVQLIG